MGFHLISLQLAFLFGRSPVMLHFVSSIRCWNMTFPDIISSLTSSSIASTSSGANERHLFLITSLIIFSMRRSRCSMPDSFAVVTIQQKCSMSFSLSLNIAAASPNTNASDTNRRFVKSLIPYMDV